MAQHFEGGRELVFIQASILQPSECAELPAVAVASSAHLTSMSASKEGDDALWLNGSTALS